MWSQEGNAFVGDARGRYDRVPLLVSDEGPWADFELSVLLTPMPGSCNAQVVFRLNEAEGSFYLFDMLLGWQAIAVSRVVRGRLTKISVVNYPIEEGQEYDVEIAAREESLTSYVDGQLVNQATDGAIRSGAVGLSVWDSRTAYRDLRYRRIH